ncbi:MAG: ubiquinone biosynthesis regulatory protein kinase UbiB, partial [Gammaproteobacteria bacterium]
FPALPRLVHRALEREVNRPSANDELLRHLLREQRRTNRLLGFMAFFVGAFGVGLAVIQVVRWYPHWAG